MLEFKKDERAFKKILKFYNIYDRNSKIDTSCFNKPNEFLSTFRYNYTDNNPLPDNINRNSDGRIILEDIPFILTDIFKRNENVVKIIYEHTHDHNAPSWLILNNGSKILLKELDTLKIEQELLAMYLYRELNLPTASYDIATIDGEDYLISNSFLAYNEYLFYPFDIINKNIFNCYDIEDMLSVLPNDCKFLLLQTIFIDIILGNWDRFPNNYGLIKTKNNVTSAPLFDNAEFSFNYNTSTFPCVNGNNDANYLISYLLENKDIVNWVKTHMTNPILKSAINRLKQEKNLDISRKTNYNFNCFLTYGEALVNEELKNRNESFRIKLV